MLDDFLSFGGVSETIINGPDPSPNSALFGRAFSAETVASTAVQPPR